MRYVQFTWIQRIKNRVEEYDGDGDDDDEEEEDQQQQQQQESLADRNTLQNKI